MVIRVIGVLIVSFLLFELVRLSGMKQVLFDVARGRIRVDNEKKLVFMGEQDD